MVMKLILDAIQKYNGGKKMPRTRGESIFFTAITAWMMVYVMTVYNLSLIHI